MFAAGCGMGLLSYYIAMEGQKISVINGCEKGGSIKKIKQAVKPDMLPRLQSDFHMFLDNLTGDLFNYNDNSQAWQPYGNIGLHWSRAEATIQGGNPIA